MKLKTLKDLGKDRDNYSYDDGNVKYFDERILKAEAVKWVKGDLALFEFGSKTSKFIIHFFNLTEEDLK